MTYAVRSNFLSGGSRYPITEVSGLTREEAQTQTTKLATQYQMLCGGKLSLGANSAIVTGDHEGRIIRYWIEREE